MRTDTTSPIRRSLAAIGDALLAVILAPDCAACGRPLDTATAGPVCPACWTSIVRLSPPVCRTCGDPLPSWRTVSLATEQCALCRRFPGAVTAGCSAGEYEGPLRRIVHAFKYDGRRSLAAPLAALMRDAGGPLLSGADYAVPVPLHPWRRLQRGFNQAADLADRIGLPVVHALQRARPTASQSGPSAAERRRNVRGAFRLSPAGSRSPQAAMSGCTVVLVDDVRTTGATLHACAGVLKAAGVREVRAITVARAPRPARVRGR